MYKLPSYAPPEYQQMTATYNANQPLAKEFLNAKTIKEVINQPESKVKEKTTALAIAKAKIPLNESNGSGFFSREDDDGGNADNATTTIMDNKTITANKRENNNSTTIKSKQPDLVQIN